MGKKNQPPKRVASPAPLKPLVAVEWYSNPLYVQLILAAIAFIYYANSIFNGYALDDVISITMNSFTKKGLAGIPDIISKDSFYGFIGNASELSGGRWRPLALISFALEWQISPNSPHLSHFINVLIYVSISVLLFRLLYGFIFKDNLVASAIATLLFIVHRVHTEVVANIKSRDELLSLLFLLLTLLFVLQYYYGKKNPVTLLFSFLFYFLALLSKENGITFIAILPLVCFVVSKDTLMQAIIKSIPFIGIAILYLVLRVLIIGFVHKEITEVMNAPFLYATPMQALATKIYILLLYIKLLFFPYPLSYDYSYNQIPYVGFENPWVIVSILVYGGLIAYAFLNILKKDKLAFGILFYLLSIFIVSNLLVDVGGTMGERFLFQASVGFCICITVLLMKLTEKIPASSIRVIAFPFFALLLLLTGYETWSRNSAWKTENKLFTTDVYTCPNSARTNNGAGTAFILLSDEVKDSVKKRALLDSAEVHLFTALKIHPKYIDPWLNLGVVYNREGDATKAEYAWNKARERDPHHPKLVEFDRILSTMLSNKGKQAFAKQDYPACVVLYRKATRYNPSDTDAWYNLGGAYFSVQKYDSARIAWTQCLQLKPDYVQAQRGINALAGK